MSSLMLRSPLDTDPSAAEGINVSELEQVKMVQGIPLYEREISAIILPRIPGRTSFSELKIGMDERTAADGKPINQGQWHPISADQMERDGKGWFDVDGEVDSSKYGPGIYELRVSVKDAVSNKTSSAQRFLVWSRRQSSCRNSIAGNSNF